MSIITANAPGQPGSIVTLRFKPGPLEIDRFKGVPALVEAVDDGFHRIAEKAGSHTEIRQLTLGKSWSYKDLVERPPTFVLLVSI